MLELIIGRNDDLARTPKTAIEGATIAKRYIAQAMSAPGGAFHAMYAAPGRTPALVFEGTEPQLFSTADDAEAKARQVLFDALNARGSSTSAFIPNQPGPRRNISFNKMTGAEFAALRAECDLTVAEVAFLWGTTPERVDRWESGADAVPFPLHWALRLLAEDQNYDAAMEIAEQHVTEKLR